MNELKGDFIYDTCGVAIFINYHSPMETAHVCVGLVLLSIGRVNLFATVDLRGQSWKHLGSTVENDKGPQCI